MLDFRKISSLSCHFSKYTVIGLQPRTSIPFMFLLTLMIGTSRVIRKFLTIISRICWEEKSRNFISHESLYFEYNISMNSGIMGRLVLKTRISGSLSSCQMGKRQGDQGVSFNLSLFLVPKIQISITRFATTL